MFTAIPILRNGPKHPPWRPATLDVVSKKPMISLADVARRAGVSKATASKALNGRSDVSAETRSRVAEAAADLGYSPTIKLPPNLGPHIWAATSTLANPYSAALLDGMLAEAQSLGAMIIMGLWSQDKPTDTPPAGSPGWMRMGLDRGAEGFILATTAVSREHHRVADKGGVPLVLIDPVGPAPRTALCVSATNWRGGVQATEHLIELGHRRIASVGIPEHSMPGTERLAGYRSALEAAGIDLDPTLVVPGRFRFDDGLAAGHLFDSPAPPTAIVAANDMVACGLLEAARMRNMSVPGDLSVVGFDDTAMASVTAPPLTTIHQPLNQMGRLAVRMCVDPARDGAMVASQVQLTTTLTVRGSTGPLAQRT